MHSFIESAREQKLVNTCDLLPQKAVIWGEGTAASTAVRLSDWGIERPVVFSTRSLERIGRGLLWRHVSSPAGCVLDLPAHAPESAIQAALEACIDHGARSIVAHGGGSVIDAAKAVSYLHQKKTGHFLPIAAFPTTLSGSEFSHNFGVTEGRDNHRFKRSYAVAETVPAVVVLDPILLVDTPRSLLLSSAIKGIDHAVEGMRTVSVDHPHAVMASSGFQRFFQVLLKWPKAIETQRAIEVGAIVADDLLQLQIAAWHCYSTPASVKYGLSHRIGHVLGGSFGLPHSATSCITLAPVIRACATFYGGKLSVFALDLAGDGAGEGIADKIGKLVRSLELPTCVGAFGLHRSARSEVEEILKINYPNEVADLGEASDKKLAKLLESIW